MERERDDLMDLLKDGDLAEMFVRAWRLMMRILREMISRIWRRIRGVLQKVSKARKEERIRKKNQDQWERIKHDHESDVRMTVKVQDLIRYKQEKQHQRGIKRK